MGIRGTQLDKIIDAASEDISNAVKTIVEEAVYQAESFGSSMGAEEFLSQIKLDASSGYIEISTDSGRLNFSTPPVPMLPWLLKNAKTAEDGSRYKVIPVGGGGLSSKPKPVARDITAGLKALSSEESSATNMAEKMAAAFGMAATTGTSQRQEPKSIAKPEFRVASSKQDATRQWVAPSKELDMSGIVMSINASVRSRIDQACDEVIKRYEKEAINGLGDA
jgi:hypothetical protein